MYGNVLFRAAHVADAGNIWSGMTGLQGATQSGVPGLDAGLAAALMVSAAIVFLAPNTQQILARFDPAYNWNEWRDVARPTIPWVWKPDFAGLAFAAGALFMGIMFIQRGRAVFLYFNF
jgi:hypothetical protein